MKCKICTINLQFDQLICPHCESSCSIDPWTSVKDKPPVVAGFYLAVADWSGIIEKSEFDGKSSWTYSFGMSTHWMELPNPPSYVEV